MKRSRLFLLIAVFAVFLLTNAVSAALDLGVDEITLDPGGFYEFTMPDGIVHWFVSDESIIELGGDEGTIGVSALQPGTAVVFAMSDDYSEADSCVVTVTGEAKAVKSGDLYYQDLTAEDLAKVNDPAIASVLSMAANTEAFPMGIGDLSGYEYKVLVMVKDGSQQKIADAAEAMGLADVWAYKYVSMAALRGSANDIAKLLIDYRDDIVSIETDQKYAVEPIEDDLESKDVSKLQGNAETLTDIKAAHALGYTGKEQYIAILDTGIKADHEQFIDEETGDSRVEYQACYSSEEAAIDITTVKMGTWDVTVYEMQYPVCEGGTTESLTSAAPSGAHYPSAFNHGTHVAAIAAGKDGVAPDAGIIAYQVFTEFVYYDYNIEKEEMVDPPRRVTSKSMVYYSDANKALEALLDLISTEDISVAAVNMSYGGLLDPEEYDPDTYSYESDTYLSQLLDKGAIPCASTMNDGLDGTIGDAAMSQYTFAVGALDNAAVPAVASYSNHSDLVDILAPGTQIYSAIYTDSYWDNTVTEGVNAYSKMNGTSMATPMVSGAFALLKQLNSEMGSEMNAEELKDQLLGMTDKTAARAGVEKPVLNFAGFYAYTVDEPMLDNEYTVDSSNRTIKVNTLAPGEEDSSLDGYKVELYKSGGTTPVQTQYAAADKDRTLTFSNLTNDTLYSVKVYKYIEVSKTKYYSAASEEAFAVPMAVPSGLTLTASGGNSITAAWKNHPNDRIYVEYSEDKTFESPEYYEMSADESGSCEIKNLEHNKLYYFRFRAIRNFDETDYYSPYSSVSTYYLPPVPQESKHFTVSNGNKSITVSLIADIANYNGYKVDIFNPATNKVVGTKTLGVSKNTPVTFTNLTNDTVYEVRVYGYKTVSKVNYFSDCASVKERPMAVPTGLKLTVDESNIVTAKWEGHEGDKFVVEYSEDGSAYTEYCKDTGTCTGTDALKQNTVYYFRFRSVWNDEEGESIFESPASTVLTKLILDKPVETTNFKVSTGNRSILVNLIAETGKYTGYKVEVYNSAGKCVSTKTISVSKDQTLTVSNLTNDQAYSVKVYGYRTVNKVNYFSADFAEVAKAVPMAVPSGFKLTTESANSVKVEWPKNETNQISVEYSTDQNGTYTTVCDKGTTPCTVAGLEADQTYYFRFRRYNVDLEYYSPYSAVSTYRIPSEPISETHYEVGNGNKTITVKLKKVDNYDGYKVDIYLGEKLKASKTQSVPKNDATINFSGLVNDTVYTVKVTGYKTVNKVNYFSVCTKSTPMAPMAVPTGLTYTAKEDDTVTAEWPNNTGKQIQVEYKVENGEYTKYCEVDGSNTCTGKPLAKDTVYYFRARWLNTTCNVYSPWSAEVSKMLLSTPETTDSTIGYKKIRVHFNDVDTLTGHQIKVYTVNPEKLVRTVNVKYTSNKDFADITGLNNGTEYRFEISAYRTVGKTTYYSESAKVKAAPQLKPIDTDAPKEVKTSGGAKKITVSWEKDTWTGGHYIELYRMDNKVMAANAYAANNATSYTFSGGNIEYDVPYMVRVWKYNEKSPKAVGDKYVDTYAVSLATPGSFNAVTADGSITISWTYSGSADKVVAYYSSTSNKGPFDGQVECTLVDGKNTCTIPNLTNSTLYYVKAAAAREYNGLTFTSVETAVKSAVPLPVLKNATVTTESKTVTVQYTKDSTVDGHIIQLYKLDNKGKASVVKTVTSDNSKVDGNNVTIEFSKLVNGTTYYVTICSYDKIGKTTYRGAIYTSREVKPTDTGSGASKNVVIMTEMTEPFDGFVDPVEELNAESEAEAVVETEVKEEEEQTSVFDLFRL